MPTEDRSGWELCRKKEPERHDCTQIHTFDGKYRHAETYEEVNQALYLGTKVRDYDGDEVVDTGANEYNQMRYEYIDTSVNRQETVGTDHPSDLLIFQSDTTPLTDAEMAEVIASLASITTTQQHNV